jgi:hypothetical protein
MKPTKDIVLDALATGKLTTLASAAAIAVCGQAELNNPVAPINAVSHILFGEEATKQDELSLKYTATGLLLHDAACTSWAALHEQLVGGEVEKGNVPVAFAGGALVSALAYFTDYYLVPKRMTPGMEKRLSGRSLFFIYSVLAGGLAFGSLLNARRKRS